LLQTKEPAKKLQTNHDCMKMYNNELKQPYWIQQIGFTHVWEGTMSSEL